MTYWLISLRKKIFYRVDYLNFPRTVIGLDRITLLFLELKQFLRKHNSELLSVCNKGNGQNQENTTKQLKRNATRCAGSVSVGGAGEFLDDGHDRIVKALDGERMAGRRQPQRRGPFRRRRRRRRRRGRRRRRHWVVDGSVDDHFDVDARDLRQQ